jgi:pantoate--beta-alanine ligase
MINKQPSAELDYIAITDARNLEPLSRLKGEVLISLAVRFGKARLIDNIKVKVDRIFLLQSVSG